MLLLLMLGCSPCFVVWGLIWACMVELLFWSVLSKNCCFDIGCWIV